MPPSVALSEESDNDMFPAVFSISDDKVTRGTPPTASVPGSSKEVCVTSHYEKIG